jgi:hypothetical protein
MFLAKKQTLLQQTFSFMSQSQNFNEATTADPPIVTKDIISLEEINRFREEKIPDIKEISFEELTAIARKMPNVSGALASTPVMELSARKPYDTKGLMDFYQPGRWDSTSNSVFMSAIRQTGPSPGQWDGTVGYIQFKAPKTGLYMVVINFTGYQATIKHNGPWGTSTAYSATASTAAAVVSIFNGTLNTNVYSSVTFSGGLMGYLKSVVFYQFS